MTQLADALPALTGCVTTGPRKSCPNDGRFRMGQETARREEGPSSSASIKQAFMNRSKNLHGQALILANLEPAAKNVFYAMVLRPPMIDNRARVPKG